MKHKFSALDSDSIVAYASFYTFKPGDFVSARRKSRNIFSKAEYPITQMDKRNSSRQRGLLGREACALGPKAINYLAPRPDNITFAVSKMVTRSSVMDMCLM
jgi:hypothetical protein